MIYTVTFNPCHRLCGPSSRQPGTGCRQPHRPGGIPLWRQGHQRFSVLRALDCDNTALGFVAGPTGHWLETGLQAQGVKTDFIHLNQGVTRINVKIKATEETEINGMGPQIAEADMKQLYAKLDKLGEGDALVLAGSIPSCLSGDTYEKIMARLEGRGVRIVVDATRDLLVNVLKYKPLPHQTQQSRAGRDL